MTQTTKAETIEPLCQAFPVSMISGAGTQGSDQTVGQTTPPWPPRDLVEKVARAIYVAEGNDPDVISHEHMAGWEYRDAEAVAAIQAVRGYDRART
jgi:hypothetical protein